MHDLLAGRRTIAQFPWRQILFIGFRDTLGEPVGERLQQYSDAFAAGHQAYQHAPPRKAGHIVEYHRRPDAGRPFDGTAGADAPVDARKLANRVDGVIGFDQLRGPGCQPAHRGSRVHDRVLDAVRRHRSFLPSRLRCRVV
jgi:hypothetical protein